MLQRDEPVDLVVATGKQHTVREFVTAAAGELGITVEWRGRGAEETAVISAVKSDSANNKVSIGQTIVAVDPNYYRPAEVDALLGDASRAREGPELALRDHIRGTGCGDG